MTDYFKYITIMSEVNRKFFNYVNVHVDEKIREIAWLSTSGQMTMPIGTLITITKERSIKWLIDKQTEIPRINNKQLLEAWELL